MRTLCTNCVTTLYMPSIQYHAHCVFEWITYYKNLNILFSGISAHNLLWTVCPADSETNQLFDWIPLTQLMPIYVGANSHLTWIEFSNLIWPASFSVLLLHCICILNLGKRSMSTTCIVVSTSSCPSPCSGTTRFYCHNNPVSCRR